MLSSPVTSACTVGEEAANGEVGFEAGERVRRGGMCAVADGKTVKASELGDLVYHRVVPEVRGSVGSLTD